MAVLASFWTRAPTPTELTNTFEFVAPEDGNSFWERPEKTFLFGRLGFLEPHPSSFTCLSGSTFSRQMELTVRPFNSADFDEELRRNQR